MAVSDSTRVCKHCNNSFIRTAKGQPTMYCSLECKEEHYRDKIRINQAAWQANNQSECKADNCTAKARYRGYCPKHYIRIKKFGDINGSAIKRVERKCPVCGKVEHLTKSQYKKKKTCGTKCGLALKGHKPQAKKEIHCENCHKWMTRTVKTKKDDGRFCGKSCAALKRGIARREATALKRIGQGFRDRVAKPEKDRLAAVAVEIAAIRRIALEIQTRTRPCVQCGVIHIRRRKRYLYCSCACHAEAKRISRERRKDSEAYKAGKRRYKSARRAAIRGADKVDRFDPLDIFERDKWRCHICGNKTLKSKRGTAHPRAPELEHIVSIADGGTHTIGNVACSCRQCNIDKGAKSFGQLGLAV